jgi:hypothetical protein
MFKPVDCAIQNVALNVTKQEGYTIEVDEFRKNMKE